MSKSGHVIKHSHPIHKLVYFVNYPSILCQRLLCQFGNALSSPLFKKLFFQTTLILRSLSLRY